MSVQKTAATTSLSCRRLALILPQRSRDGPNGASLSRHRGASEFLRQRQQEGLALAELRSADAYAQTVADLILVVEQVDDVETQLRALAEADRYFLHERGVDDG